jgi:hypothetical protein
MRNVRFGSQADLFIDDSATAASGAKPQVRFVGIGRKISLGVQMFAFIESSLSDYRKSAEFEGH